MARRRAPPATVLSAATSRRAALQACSRFVYTAGDSPPDPRALSRALGREHGRERAIDRTQDHLDPRRARAQPQVHRRGPAARPAGRDHGAVGLGQVLAGLRHDLRRGTAPLCRVALGLCAPVPRHDVQARRGPYLGPLARDLDRAEDHLEEPALDRRHGDRDLRLPAPAVRPRRHALFARHRQADRGAAGLGHGRPGDGDGGGDARLPARPHRARPQGRIPQGVRRAQETGLPAGEGRRRVL